MWGGALIAAVLGTRLPGPGTVYAGQTLKFHAPVRVGDTAHHHRDGEVSRDEATRLVVLDCQLHEPGRPDGHLRRGDGDRARRAHRAPARHAAAGAHRRCSTATTWCACCSTCGRWAASRWRSSIPATSVSLSAALDARAAGLIEPVLIGPRERLQEVAQKAGAEDRRPRRSRTCRTATPPRRAPSSSRSRARWRR